LNLDDSAQLRWILMRRKMDGRAPSAGIRNSGGMAKVAAVAIAVGPGELMIE